MANIVEYIFSLRDKISSPLHAITATSDRTAAVLTGVQQKIAGVESITKDTGRTLGSLKAKIDALQAEKEWIPANNIPALKTYNRETAKLTKEVTQLENAGTGRFRRWADEAFNAIPGGNLLRNPLAAGAAAVTFAGAQALNFDEGMAKVNITAQLDPVGLSDLKKKLKGIAKDNKTDIVLAPEGFEQINSQLNDVDLSLSILDASLKGSKAGFADLKTVSAALAQTMSIVGKENTTAAEVLDTFFAAKRVGAGEFADFAKYMPNLIAGASNLGIAYKEVAGTFAYMTGKGQSAEKAAVLMENAFSILGRGEVRDKMAKAGVNVFDDAGKIRGVVDIFGDLQRVLAPFNDEQKSSILEKFGLVDKEAKNAFAVLTSDIDKLQSSMSEVADSAGETGRALEFSKNATQKATEVWAQFKNIGLQVGELMLPVIGIGLEAIGGVLEVVGGALSGVMSLFSGWWTLLGQGDLLTWGLTTAVGAFTAALLVNTAVTKGAMIASGAKKVVDAVCTGGTWAMTTAQWALNTAFYASPLGWIAAGIALVVGAVTLCWKKFEGFRKVLLGTWEVLKEFGKALFKSLLEPFKLILSGIGGICSAIVNLFKGNFKEAWEDAKTGAKDFAKGIVAANPISMAISATKNVAQGDYTGAWEKGKQAGADSWAKSQQEKAATPETPDVPVVPTPQIPALAGNYDALMKKLGTDSKAKGVKRVLKLDDDTRNLNRTSEYVAATQGLGGTVQSLPASISVVAKPAAVAAPAISTPAAVAPKVDDRTQAYAPERENFLQDIMLNVRKIAAATLIATAPLPVAAAPTIVPKPSDAYVMPAPRPASTRTQAEVVTSSGRTIRVEKVCDTIVINVANTDQKGADTIRAEIIKVLEELGGE